MHMGVDEPGQEEPGPMIDDRRIAKLGREVRERAAEGDATGVLDRKHSVRQRDQRSGTLRHRRVAGDVKDVTSVYLHGTEHTTRGWMAPDLSRAANKSVRGERVIGGRS